MRGRSLPVRPAISSSSARRPGSSHPPPAARMCRSVTRRTLLDDERRPRTGDRALVDIPDRLLEGVVGGLGRPVGPQDTGLPAAEIALVGELEVEEGADGG